LSVPKGMLRSIFDFSRADQLGTERIDRLYNADVLFQDEVHDKGRAQRVQGVHVAGHPAVFQQRHRDVQLRLYQLTGASRRHPPPLRSVEDVIITHD
jgi:hypothetical protein